MSVPTLTYDFDPELQLWAVMDGEGYVVSHQITEDQAKAAITVPAVLSEKELYVEDDMGSETHIRTLHSDTMLGIRKVVRELSPGHIAIDSPYDCTGRKCFQSCKILKVYKTYPEGYVAVVELRCGFDV